ncbi:ABC transporter ATP-binding protein [Acuticoccus sediminis]|uniref:ABC transporter ATP-binding protein n=1 Tax=Acuticoccus sediminis TaxID=2184697 RepID=A0A8B2NQ03_9HYPH|nr:ABC transporter ATP-binding protein [Acuticoccus sediminis]RAI01966.1 ABC transporter ATP-binding protein [Acuticoccus sediminis]
MTDTPPVLSIRDYALSYKTASGPVRILDDVTLTIGRGEVLGLVGESGSAKSSLANAIIRDLPGRVAHEGGEILLSGENLTTMGETALEAVRGKRIAMVFQNAGAALDPTQTLGSHLEELLARHAGLEGAAGRARAKELIAMVGLPDPDAMLTRYAHEVSGGEKQRIVLALAFACNPELILFDEPTSALDATTAATLLDLFRELQAKTGVSGLFISHDLGTVAEIADRIAVIYGGRIVEVAEPGPLFAAPRHPYTRALLASLPRPSDTRTGRSLDISGARPAPRRGTPPPCIYSGSCAYHRPEICDAAPVRLHDMGERRVACARAEEIAGQPDAGSAHGTEPGDIRPVRVFEGSGLRVTYGRDRILDRLTGRSRKVRAVNDVGLTLNRGETLGLVGESGCGKSTLARALVGLIPFEGEVKLDGITVASIDRAYRGRVQMVFQNPDNSLNPRHSIATLLSRPLKLYRGLSPGERRAEIGRILERVRLPADYAERYPHQLSGGEKQRVAIARAIAAQPEVIICDEVTSGLDAAVQAAIVALLAEIQRDTGCAMVFITHDLAILRHVAHRVAVMYLGEIVETRSVASLDETPYHPYTEALMSSSPSIDPMSETRRIRLTGTLPRRTERLAGCPFESRCPRRVGDICATTPPPWREARPDHGLLCHIPIDELKNAPPVWRFKTQVEA